MVKALLDRPGLCMSDSPGTASYSAGIPIHQLEADKSVEFHSAIKHVGSDTVFCFWDYSLALFLSST